MKGYRSFSPLLLCLLVACGSSDSVTEAAVGDQVTASPVVEIEALNAGARAAVMALGGTLKGQLKAAMTEGGPTAAIAVCHEEAPVIAQQVSHDTGFSVGRVSLKPRNREHGVPSAWQKAVLADFAGRLADGEDPQTIAWQGVVDGEYRFMKAIPTEGICLTCHGSALQPAVTDALASLYPADEATGYELGELRGAFVVTRPVD